MRDFAETLRHLAKEASFLETWQQESDTLASKYEIHNYVEQLVLLCHVNMC